MKTTSALILLLLGAALSVAKAAEGGLSTEMTPTKLSMVTIGTTTNTTTDPAKNMTTSITITVTKTTMMDKETNTMTTILTKTTTETMVTSTQIDNATPQTTMRPIEDPVNTLPPIGPPMPDWTEDHMGTGMPSEPAMPSEPVEMGSTMEPPIPDWTEDHMGTGMPSEPVEMGSTMEPPIPDWTEDHMGTGMPSEPVEMGSTMEQPLPETTVVHVTQSTSVVNDEVDALPKPASTHKPSSGNGPVTSQKTTSTMSILSPSISLSAVFILLLTLK
ncbi:hypothetical protein EGR_08357 [Echinococcus granulosus]|uniref:Uncharacterized protein n=1 Tax=Echinococcus granulosus TaxID=6210 RepID=W6UTN1_ECHGR|nr:hypothetical protein EGR_08357 [Echinococcus granulosus]EUB56779.1 hypothetical protein EGR_08357 [Echinococcus granulosus]